MTRLEKYLQELDDLQKKYGEFPTLIGVYNNIDGNYFACNSCFICFHEALEQYIEHNELIHNDDVN